MIYSRKRSGRLQVVYFLVEKKAFENFAPVFFFVFAELFAQGTEDTELTLTREGDYVGSTDDFVEVRT